jgi:hypothetical protein
MKKLGLSLAAVLACGGFGAQAAGAPAAADAPAAQAKAAPRATTHKIQAEVVSTDVEKKTITFKVEGAEKTAPVGPLAMFRLKKLNAGDKVILTFRDEADAGDQQEVSFIRMAPPAAPASPAPGQKPE